MAYEDMSYERIMARCLARVNRQAQGGGGVHRRLCVWRDEY